MVELLHHFRNLSNTSDFYYQQRYNSSDSEDALTVEQYLRSIKPFSDKHTYWTFDNTLKKAAFRKYLQNKQLIVKLSPNGETKRLVDSISIN